MIPHSAIELLWLLLAAFFAGLGWHLGAKLASKIG